MRRNLSRSENLYAGEMRTQAVRTITVRGGVDPDALGAAFAAVLADHPSLRSRLEQDAEGSFLSPLKPDELPRLVVRAGSPDGLVQEWNTPLPLGGPLVRAVLLTGADEDTLVLGTDHAICDGRSATALCVRLWQYYADIKAGTHPPVRPVREDWPAAIDDRLAPVTETDVAAYVQGRLDRAEGAPVGALPYLAARSGEVAPQQGRTQSRRLQLDVSETASLLAFARSAGVSVHGLVGAAILAAVRSGLPAEYADHRLGCVSTVDLRERVEPRLSREVMVPAASWYQDLVDVPAGADLVALGRRLATGLKAAVGRGDPALELQSLDRLLATPHLLAASVVMTNIGRVILPPSPPGLEITDMRGFAVSSKAPSFLQHGPVLAVLMTVRDRFRIEMPYSTECFTEAQMDAVHDHVRATLREFADRVPVPAG
ncbi:phthiocerol/phthiodiolone dimycocerosyl transferase [Streptomyces olivaceoviridis]|uniref:phthiocerol/phthiodiolone dimycocerosyl transferase family protein n=1 Tax=Streptomyces olivaceoviridis TaxID=1921 RepID=UPI001679840B|nr:condensation domain-containing protein [Streptomyces olivaceoviridis]GGZ20417.1 phthiocerol/phthiodiolone dimycocerosyl transferase [Streptomyces olivaceoviridis]